MATILPTIEKVARGVYKVKWVGLTEADEGGPFSAKQGSTFLPDKTVHVKGNFGTGGTVLMEGGNDEDTPSYVLMTDIHANPASYTAESLDVLSENPVLVRPRVSAGTGVSVDVIIVAHGVRPTR